MRPKLLAVVILVLSAVIGLSVFEGSAGATRLITWTQTAGAPQTPGAEMYCVYVPSGQVLTSETSKTLTAARQLSIAMYGGIGLFELTVGNCFLDTDGCDDTGMVDFNRATCTDGTWSCQWPVCGWIQGSGTWDVIVSMPTAAVNGAPGTWQNTDAQASVSCSQPLGSCDASSYRLLIYSYDPGPCPGDYSSYPLSSPQTISSHAWVCAAAKDTAGDVGFSIPVEFPVDKSSPTGTISIENGALYTTSSSVTLSLTYSDTGGSNIQTQGCRYSNDGVFDSEPWEACNPTKSWNLLAGLGQRTVFYQIRDKAGNTFVTSYSILVVSAADSCNYASNGFYCCVRNGLCQGSEVDVFHMSDRMNAHAEILPQNLYPYKVCCGGVPGLGTNCNGLYDILIKLFSQTNSHIEKSSLSNYPFPACLSITAGFADCDYTNAADCSAIGPGYTCVATMSADTNAHASDCDGIGDFNTKVCCKFGPPPCQLQTTSITSNCAGGSSPNCEVGETISMSATTTGECSAIDFFQIDASGGCSLQYLVPPGDLSGISQNNPTKTGDIVSGTVSGTWTIISIPAACSGKTVTANAAGLYAGGPPGTGTQATLILGNFGSFTFKDVIPPTTTINPNGNAPSWSNTDISFTLTCTDTGGGTCQTTYYKVIDSTQLCAAGGFSTGNSGTITCPAGSVCQRKVCYYSTDTEGNTESIKTSNVFQIDKILPVFSVIVSHSPAAPTNADPVTFTAIASDSGSGLSQIIIYVDGAPMGSCGSSPCVITPGTYPSGTHTYYAIARDLASNQARDPAAGEWQFTVTGCTLQPATIIPNCAGGSSPNCEVGETVSMSATTTADCSAVRFFQIDASGGGCSVQYSVPPGDLSGISQNNPTIGVNTVIGTWVITSIPLACSGKTVTASSAALYNPGPPPAGLITLTLLVTGSFTFKDVIPPTTTINPNGNAPSWSNTDISFTLTCTDTGGGTCQTTYYKVIDSTQLCAAGGFSTGNSGTITCPAGSVCQRKVCYYSTDTEGNTESIKTSNVFQIDRASPSAWLTQPSGGWINMSSFPVSWSGLDSGSGISNYNVQYKSTLADGTLISDWVDWLSKTALTSASFGPSQNNYTYYFRANATDSVGNTGLYSAERSISVDTESPNISYTVNDDKANSIFNLSSVAWDNVSGIFNHTISCTVINPFSTQLIQCKQANQFGGVSNEKIGGTQPCQTDAIPYTDETEINCEIKVQDRASNSYSRNIFFTSAPDNLIMKLHEHNIFISIGESYHIRVQLRNIKPMQDMINVSLEGTYPSGLARFLQSSPIIWMSGDKRNITAMLNPYEQKTIYLEIISTDQGDYTLDLQAGSQTYPIKSSDSLSILIGLPAAFPGLEIYSIAAILSVAAFAYFRYLRRQNKI